MRDALATAAPALPVRFDDQTGQHHTIRLQPLPDDLQPELVEPAERCQVGAGELGNSGSLTTSRFSDDGVGTSKFERPGRLPDDRRAASASASAYSLVWEEPVY